MGFVWGDEMLKFFSSALNPVARGMFPQCQSAVCSTWSPSQGNLRFIWLHHLLACRAQGKSLCFCFLICKMVIVSHRVYCEELSMLLWTQQTLGKCQLLSVISYYYRSHSLGLSTHLHLSPAGGPQQVLAHFVPRT